MIYLVRHGQTDWNLERRIQGPEIPLNETGKNEARICAQKLVSVGIERIISSDILRARQTANIINEFLSVPVDTDERLREAQWGDLRGKTIEEISSEEWYALKHTPHKIHAQSLSDAYTWIKDFFDEIDTSRNILAVTHEGVIQMVKYLAQSPTSFDQEAFEKATLNFKVSHTAVFKWDKGQHFDLLP